MAESILTQRGKPKFVYEGYMYLFDKISSADKEVQFYRCERKNSCKARLHIKNNEVIRCIKEHSHEATPARIERDRILTNIKKRSLDSAEMTSQVVNDCIGNLSQACQGTLPSEKALKKMIRRTRKSMASYADNLISIQEPFHIPEQFKIYYCNAGETEDFLLADSGVDATSCRILIFGRRSNVSLLRQCETFFVDCTFKIAPPLFSQVYVISVEINGGVLPVLYALLPNNLPSTYDKLFAMISEVEPAFQPRIINCDFDATNFKSLKERFPEAEIRGCFFHLTQNLKDHLYSLGFASNYRNDANFNLKCKMISSLAFVPIDHVGRAIMELSHELPDELQDILDWFENNYFGRIDRRDGTRRDPRFPHEMWNLHQRVLDGEDYRTNNHAADAARRKLSCEIELQHPNIWKFIDCLKKIQMGSDLYYEELVAGQETPYMNFKKFKDGDIPSLVHNFDPNSIIDFLREISHNYE